MRNYLNQISAVVWKDFVTEWKTKELFSSMFVFALLVILIFIFSVNLSLVNANEIGPGILWVAILFSGTIGLNRSFMLEKENGCLQVLPRAHRSGVTRHYTGGQGGYLEITKQDLPNQLDPVTVPVPAGGVLFMTNLTPHRSSQHTVDIVRWATDIRYQAATVPNNVGELPVEYTEDRPIYEIACYPPEADFVIQSPEHPEGVVSDWDQFTAIRQRYEDERPPGPRRGWEPIPQ